MVMFWNPRQGLPACIYGEIDVFGEILSHSHQIILLVDLFVLMVLQSLHYLLESLVKRPNLVEMLRLTSAYYNPRDGLFDLLVNPELGYG